MRWTGGIGLVAQAPPHSTPSSARAAPARRRPPRPPSRVRIAAPPEQAIHLGLLALVPRPPHAQGHPRREHHHRPAQRALLGQPRPPEPLQRIPAPLPDNPR